MNQGLLGAPLGLPLLGGPPVGYRPFTSGTIFTRNVRTRRLLVVAIGGGQGGQNTAGGSNGATATMHAFVVDVEQEPLQIPMNVGAGGGTSLGAGGSTTLGSSSRLLMRAPGGATGLSTIGTVIGSDASRLLMGPASHTFGQGGNGGFNSGCSFIPATPGAPGIMYIWEFA